MSIKDLAWDVGALLVVAAVGFGAGVVRGDHLGTRDMQGLVDQAHRAQQTAEARERQTNGTLDQLQRHLAQQAEDLRRARVIAGLALDQRDAAQHKLAQLSKQRMAAVEKLAHENHDCRALDHLPVCPAIAERLFQPRGEAQPAAAVGDRAGHAGVPAGTAPAH